jgi:hypothetical protein
MPLFSDTQIDDLKARHPCAAVAGEWVRLRRARSRKGFTHAGPCPLCSGPSHKKTDTRFVAGPDTWACASCGQGGDVLALWAARHGLDLKADFKRIVDELGGTRAVEETPASAARGARAAFAKGLPRDPAPDIYAAQPSLLAAWRDGWDKARRQADYETFARERERKRLYEHYWQKATAWPGSPVETYLTLRALQVPPHAQLRFMADCPYFADGSEREPVVLHRGPAMLAAIRDADGIFRGLHFTWIDASLCDPSRTTLDDGAHAADAAARKFKARIIEPASGEVLKSKKSRGTKQGGYIDLGGIPHGAAPLFDRQSSGEGIESTLAVYTAMVKTRRPVAGVAWRCGIDIGNLVGAAAESERHPTLKDRAGRTRNVPGGKPDMRSPAMPVIAGCRDYVQLADGDSDAFTTHCAMARGEVRRRAEGTPTRTLWPPAGLDFNDWIMSGQGLVAKGLGAE